MIFIEPGNETRIQIENEAGFLFLTIRPNGTTSWQITPSDQSRQSYSGGEPKGCISKPVKDFLAKGAYAK